MTPIFPLGTVLFPGGVLPLQVFEARYTDMVRECVRDDSGFGVCLITAGREVGDAAEHETIGCLARIIDWDMTRPGILEIRTLGAHRFRVVSRQIDPSGLVRAETEAIDDDVVVAVPGEFAACTELLRRIVDDLAERDAERASRILMQPFDFGSASWVSNRLCEFLPLSMPAKQKLLELDDPVTRLSLVHQYLKQQRVL